MERLGLGPNVLHADNPRLVYGRMTGWGQTGPRARDPGHDIDYLAVSGTLHALGATGGKPTPPINLVGDFGGGAMLLAAPLALQPFPDWLVNGRAGLVLFAVVALGAALAMWV